MNRRNLLGAVTTVLTFAAFADQLRRPAGQRTWYGRIAGVPYDFRTPTWERSVGKIWNPDNPSIMAPTIWGVGWTINLYRLAHPLRPS